MSARSLQQQDDLFYLLASKSELATVSVHAEARGVTENTVDEALGARRARGGKKSGLVLIVLQPSERPADKDAQPILITRLHGVRIIEVPEINRKSGGTQITADLAKDYVMQRLHMRYLGRAALLWRGNEPWMDEKGGYGWTVGFEIIDELASEARAAQPIITFAEGICSITGAGSEGEILYYTINGAPPVPAIAGVEIYAGPFAVADGVTVRASSVATGRLLSDFSEEVAPDTDGTTDTLTTEGGDTLITEDGNILTTET